MFISLAVIYTVLLYIPNVYSQGDGSQFCNSGTTCVVVKDCPHLTTQQQRRNANKCGFQREGGRKRARICCPGHVTTEAPPVRETSVRRRPRPPTGWMNTEDCGLPRNATKQRYVIGGTRATAGQFPWLVTLTTADQDGRQLPICSAFLVTFKHVMTAAHCFQDSKRPSLYEARIGRSPDWRHRRGYALEAVKVHEGYQDHLFYDDIAVLTLKETVGDPGANVVCLPDNRMKSNLTGQGTTVAGWGVTEAYRGASMSNVLMYVEGLTVVSNDECGRIFRTKLGDYRQKFPAGVISGFLCAGVKAGGKDACQGDSGAPLMYFSREYKWYVVGVVSFGKGCGEKDLVGGYTRVSDYIDWVKKNTEQ